MENILQQWNTIWNYSHLYVERLKCVEIVLASLDEARNVVSELEIKLVSFGEMPSELEPLRNVSILTGERNFNFFFKYNE